jgi:insulysin
MRYYWGGLLIISTALAAGLNFFFNPFDLFKTSPQTIPNSSQLSLNLMKELGYQERRIRLKNGLEAWLIHVPSIPLSSTAIAFGVGSADDPVEHMGLSHFLEHMVFLGSRRFNEEKGFAKFISEKGGSHNACTHLDKTVYGFSCQSDHWKLGCERIADMLQEPTLSESASERERYAIEEELQKKLSQDGYKAWLILCDQAPPLSPLNKLHIGNIETLKGTHSEDLRHWLKAFYQANNAKIVTISNRSLDEMSATLEECFGSLQSGFVASSTESPSFKILDERLLIMPTTSADSILQLNWSFSASEVTSIALNMICELISHPDQAGLCSYLKQLGWIYNLEAGALTSSSFNLLQVELKLTPLGMSQLSSIKQIVFDYLGFLNQKSWPAYLLAQWQNHSTIQWQSYAPKGSLEEGLNLAAILLNQPLATFPDQSHWPTPSDEKLAKQALTSMTTSSTISLLLAPYSCLKTSTALEKLLDSNDKLMLDQKKIEPWSKTTYYQTAWPKKNDNSTSLVPIDWQLPSQNPFLPIAVSLLNPKSDPSVEKNRISRLTSWGTFNQIPNLYEAGLKDSLCWTISFPQSPISPLSSIHWQLIADQLHEELDLLNYQASQAYQDFAITPFHQGLKITFQGINGVSQQKIIQEISHKVFSFRWDEPKFSFAKDRLRQHFETLLASGPWEILSSRLQSNFIQERFSPEELLQALNLSTFDQLPNLSSIPSIRFDLMIISNRSHEDWQHFFADIYQLYGDNKNYFSEKLTVNPIKESLKTRISNLSSWHHLK